MYNWVKKRLQQQSGVRLQQREAWWRALQWYFGYCSKKKLGDPFDAENGTIFLTVSVFLPNQPHWMTDMLLSFKSGA